MAFDAVFRSKAFLCAEIAPSSLGVEGVQSGKLRFCGGVDWS